MYTGACLLVTDPRDQWLEQRHLWLPGALHFQARAGGGGLLGQLCPSRWQRFVIDSWGALG